MYTVYCVIVPLYYKLTYNGIKICLKYFLKVPFLTSLAKEINCMKTS